MKRLLLIFITAFLTFNAFAQGTVANAVAQNVTVNLSASGTATLNATSVNNGSTGAGTLSYTIQKIVYGRVSENNTLTLSTPNGVNFTAIRFASYGTPTNDANGNYSLGSCNAANSVTTALNSFVGRSSGSIDAVNGSSANNNPTLGDPCSGTPKALAIQAAYSSNAGSLTYSCSEAGQNSYVLLTVTDSNGSTSTATAKVTVNLPSTALLTSVSPSTAAPGATVTVSGTNLSGASSLTVNGASATISNLSSTGFTFVVPATAASSGNVSVSVPCSQTLATGFTVDATAPTVSSVSVPANGTYKTGDQLTFSVNFSENVNVTGTPQLSLTIGSTQRQAAYQSGNGTSTLTFSYTLTAGEADADGITIGSLGLNSGTIKDAAGNNAMLTLNTVSSTAGVLVEAVAPLVNSVNRESPASSTVNSGDLTYRVTFSEAVTGVTTSGFTLTATTGTATGSISSVAAVSGSNATQFDVTVSGISGNGNLRLDVKTTGTGITDAAGNGLSGGFSTGQVYTYISSSAVSSITGQTPSPTATSTVSYTVTFSQPVSGLTTSNFTLSTSGSISGASVTSVSGSGTTYTVTVNTGSGDGSLRLNLDNSTGVSVPITNAPYTSGTTYTITKNFAAAPTLRIQAGGSASGNGDVTAFVDQVQVLQNSTPFIAGIQNSGFETNNVSAGSYLYSPSVVASPWTFGTQAGIARNGSGFDPQASSGDAVALLQSAGGNNGSVSQNLAVPTGSYQVSFQARQRTYTSRDQTLNVFMSNVFIGSIQPDYLSFGSFNSATFTVFAPALTATISSAAGTLGSTTATTPIPFSISFSQSVGTTFTAADLTISGGSLTSGSFSGSGSGPYTFSITPSGAGTVSVSLAGGVATDGNNTSNSATGTYSLVYSPLTVVSINRVNTNPTNANTVSYTVTFSASVTGVDATDFTLTKSGANGSIGTPTGSGTTWTVPITSVTGTGTLRLDFTGLTGITPNATAAFTSGEVYTIDKTPPTTVISSTAGADGAVTNVSPIPFTVTFSETVTGFVAGDVSVTNGTIANFSGSGTTYTFNITPSASGYVYIDVIGGVAQDGAGNNNLSASTYSLNYQQVLPVTLISFTATAEGNAARLNWSTASEQNNKAFSLYRSVDGKLFTAIGTLAGHGTAGGRNDYVFYDHSPLSGTNYYKLVQTDNDGRESELGIRALNFRLAASNSLLVYPNPAVTEVTVSFPAGVNLLELADLNGKRLQKLVIEKNATSAKLNIADLASGTYLLRVSGVITEVRKLVKL